MANKQNAKKRQMPPKKKKLSYLKAFPRCVAF